MQWSSQIRWTNNRSAPNGTDEPSGLPSVGFEFVKPAKCPCQRAVERIAAEDAKADGHHGADGGEEVLDPRQGS